jgi:uncharacterized membrane protein HdeD (DUF308 family)
MSAQLSTSNDDSVSQSTASAKASIPEPQRAGSGGRLLLGIGGVVAAILGLLVLAHPLATGVFALRLIALLVALYAFVLGIIYIIFAISARDRSGWGRVGAGVLGVLFFAGGVVLACNLLAVEAVLPVLISITIGVLWLVEGIAVFTVTRAKNDNRGWVIFSGVISILAGISLLFAPLAGIATLWWVTGIAMVVLGIVQAIRSFSKQTTAA